MADALPRAAAAQAPAPPASERATPAAAGHPGGIHRFYSVAISPDGSRVASVEADQPAAGGEPSAPHLLIRHLDDRRVTEVAVPCEQPGTCGVFSPVWSADGRHLGFGIRAPNGFRRTLAETDPDGGDLHVLLAFDGTIIALHYGPDGRMAGLATAGARQEAGAARAAAPQTGEIGTTVPERRIGIVENGAMRWASPPGLYVYEYDWMPDGSGFIGTAAAPSAIGEGDAVWWSAKLYAFASTATNHGQQTDAPPVAKVIYAPSSPRQQIAQPKVSPDGRMVSFIGGLMSDFINPGGDVFVLPLRGTGGRAARVARNLTAGEKATATTVTWGCAPGSLVASTIRGGDGQIVDIDAASGASRVAWSDRAVLNAADTAVSLSCATGIAAAIRETFTEAPEIVSGPLGRLRALTAVNAGVAVPFTVESIDWTSDGMAMQGWLLRPRAALPGASATARMPMITVVHGGPAAAVEPYFFGPGFDRALLEHGAALFMPNPRGSYGQGEAFTQANVRDFGHGDLRDILAGVRAVVAGHPIDPARLGITGLSYGGYMTVWATTQTQMFKAAVARAPITDWLSYYGENGIGGWLPPYFGASVYDDPAIYARSSPIGFIRQARTPTLLMVGERDIECPPPQSRELWHALRERGTPTDLVIYAGEGHDFWSTATVTDAERRATAWFDRYLR